MSNSPQWSPSQDSYPQSGKPVGGYRGEDPPQRGQKQQQQHQGSPVRFLPQGHPLQSNNPDKQSSHQNFHHHRQQQSIPLGVPSSSGYPHYPESHSSLPGYQSSHNQPRQQQPPGVLSQGYNPKDNDFSNNRSPIQSHKQVITSPHQNHPQDHSATLPGESFGETRQELTTEEAPVRQRNLSESSGEDHINLPKDPNPTSYLPIKDQGEKHLPQTKDELILQPVAKETNSKVYLQRNYHSLKVHTNGSEQKPNPPREPFPVPEGYPPLRPPTSPSKLEPRPKKGLLKKICCFLF